MSPSSPLKALFAVGILVMSCAAVAQRSGTSGSNKNSSTPSIPSTRTPGTTDQVSQPVFVSGKVFMDGGGALSEPVPIERVCNGVVRREGYTDTKGQFQFQLGQTVEFQDASSTDTPLLKNLTPQTTGTTQDTQRLQFLGCEFRAVLPGFQSTSALLKMQGSTWQYDVGTIFLKRLADVKGATISLTTMSAPKDARHAYEKGEKAFSESKFPEAEKELTKAVDIYPAFAAAWSLLGDVHQQQNQYDEAIQAYSRAVSADPQYVKPQFGLALVAVQQKRWQDAATFTGAVMKLNAAAFPSAYFYNAVANYNAGNLDAAEESAKKYKSVDAGDHHHPEICLLLSEIMAHKHNYSAAAQEMRDYLALRPNAPEAQQLRDKMKNLDELSAAKPTNP